MSNTINPRAARRTAVQVEVVVDLGRDMTDADHEALQAAGEKGD